jgi:hypothetical protein
MPSLAGNPGQKPPDSTDNPEIARLIGNVRNVGPPGETLAEVAVGTTNRLAEQNRPVLVEFGPIG